MLPFARIRHLSLVLAAVGAFAAPALAGERAARGCSDDPAVRSRSNPAPEGGTGPNAPGARAPSTSINPVDDAYAPRAPRATPASPGRAPELNPAPAASAPAAPVPAARKRDAASSLGRTARPAPQRVVKVSMRNLPATPGMGTLLRVGVTAGREIS